MSKRTKINFDKHELNIIESPNAIIHYLKIPGSSQDNIKFINAGGIMAVTGDYGNWIFCREFHPIKEGRADDQYMTEKLRIASSQEPYEIDSEAIKAEIQEMMKFPDYSTEEIRFFEELLEKADCPEQEYKSWAYENCPSDPDIIPYCKDIKYWLKAVYDGFDEICERLKNNSK